MDFWSSSYDQLFLIARSLDRPIARSLDLSIAGSLGRSVARSHGRPVVRSLGRSVARFPRLLDRLIARSLVRSTARYTHSTCVYYDHSTCIMSCMAHVRRNESMGGWGAARHPNVWRRNHFHPPAPFSPVFPLLPSSPNTKESPTKICLAYIVYSAPQLAGSSGRLHVEFSVNEAIQRASRVGG